MIVSRKVAAFLVLAAVAGGGYLFVTQAPALLAQYQQARDFSPAWGYVYLGVFSAAVLAALLLAGWTFMLLARSSAAKQARRTSQNRNPSQMSGSEQAAETEQHLQEVGQLADDPTLPADVRAPLKQALAEVEQKRAGQTLEIVAFGTISSGKSSLLNALAGRDVFRTDPQGGTTCTRSEIAWPGADKVVLVDTPGLAEVAGNDRAVLARQSAADADLVLLVVDGPLKDFERQVLEQLAQMEKRVLLCLNKEDWFAPRDRERLLAQLVEQTAGLVQPADVVSLRARPAVRTRVRVLASGQEIEETVEEPSDISALAERMLSVVSHDGQDLLAANLLLQARGLATEAKQQIRSTLDKQAEAIVTRAMWQAAAAAALSPLPLLDVAASLTVTTNMVVGLARVYRQTIDLDTVSRLIGELGKNLAAILGSSLAAPAIGSAVASLLKTVPGVGTLTGGLLQGLVQALVTRWIGRIFIVYFRSDMQQPALGWAALARSKWSEVTRPAELADLVKTGLARLRGKS